MAIRVREFLEEISYSVELLKHLVSGQKLIFLLLSKIFFKHQDVYNKSGDSISPL